MLFCGECGDLFCRIVWNIHGRKQPVWRCMTRMQSGVGTCACRTVDEEVLKSATIEAINKAFLLHRSKSKVLECIEETLREGQNDQATARDEQIRTLQLKLMSYRSTDPEVETIGAEIIRLRNQKDALASQDALNTQRANEIRELASFFDGLSGPLTEYDETYVRRLLNRITVYEDRLVFQFKDGKEITIE